jgi:hypothetical protein
MTTGLPPPKFHEERDNLLTVPSLRFERKQERPRITFGRVLHRADDATGHGLAPAREIRDCLLTTTDPAASKRISVGIVATAWRSQQKPGSATRTALLVG